MKSEWPIRMPTLRSRVILSSLNSIRRSVISVRSVFVALFMQQIAQACPMCYQNAQASGTQGITALRHGILILFLPAASLFVGIFVLIYRRRNASR